MKPEMLSMVDASADQADAIPKIHVLEPGKENWDVIRDVAHSGVQEEAFYVMDIGDIIRKHKEWKLKMPRVAPFYAVKCNDNRTVLETLSSLGASFDCASKSEIAKVLELGVETDRIIFANPAKQVSHIRYAASVDVRAMTFDNESELYKVKEHHPTAKMVLRIRCDAKRVQCPLGIKFGAFPKDAPRLIALAAKLGVDLVGISFHVGSGCDEPEVFERCIVIGRQLFDLAAREYGINMSVLDLGGGYPGNRGSSINAIAAIVNSALERHFPEGCGVDIIAEPGRYYVASAFTLATRIHGRRQLTTDDEESDGPQTPANTSYFYYINDGVYGSFNCMLYDHAVVTPLLLEPRPGPDFSCSIWGPTCDGLDRIAANAQLPLMDVGDWLIFEDMGAYTLAAAGCFNGFPVPKVYPVVQPHTWLYLKDRAPYTESHFVMGSPSPVPAADLLPKISCAMEMYASGNNNNGGTHLLMPSSVCSSSIDTEDPSTSDAVSTSSDGDVSDAYGDSADFLADLLDVTSVM
ncbi:ornithine decarboxylase-like [Daphnia carinata]|uniref:ornithine decarboxylase-like n=1 Tax=Daphnia carinata TaxID=120202 RepID=UPI00257BA627|nr:ornithine decarboxylase-like [Daphnia carinata]